MSDNTLAQKIAALSPEKRDELLKQLRQKRAVEEKTTPAIPRIPRNERAYPLSFAQQRLWFLDQFEPQSAQYNMPYALRLTGQLNHEALQQALEQIIHRHESLRTTFTTVAEEGAQLITAPTPFILPTTDLRGEDDPLAAAQAMIATEAQAPFDLVLGPLLRLHLLQVATDDHVLLITFHHIVSDGWSYNLFMGELTTLYRALVVGESATLPELPVQYADFAQWQRDWLRGERMETQLGYWKGQLKGAPSVDLPTDHPRPPVRTYRGAIHTHILPPSLSESLYRFSRANGTLFMTLLAGFQTLLYRYSGQADVTVGTLIANRTHQDIEPLIGFFANTLALRTSLEGNPTFTEAVSRAKNVTLSASAHQDLPFEKLVDELKLPRDLSRAPLFQTLLILQNAPGGGTPLPHLTAAPMEADSRTAKFDLTLYISDGGGELLTEWEYNSDLFEGETIARMATHLETLLAAAMAEPHQRVGDLPLMMGAEREHLLTAWNQTTTAFPDDLPLHTLIEARAAEQPTRTAVTFGATTLTYQDLDSRANQLAHHLRAAGVREGARVALCVERSLEMVVALLAIWKVGGAYIPLDPHYPQERIALMLDDADVTLLLTQGSLLSESGTQDAGRRNDEGARQVISTFRALRPASCLTVDDPVIADYPTTPPETMRTADALAYIIYTSGSTGKPKGVQIPHRALVNFLATMQAAPGFTADDTLLAVTSLSFDIAGLELYLPLLTGGHLHLASRDEAGDGAFLKNLLESGTINVMQATPATWRLLIDAGWQGTPHLKILCGGEAIPPALVGDLLERGASVWNMYGPTETTIWSAVRQLTDTRVTLGKPIANTQLYVLDGYGQPTPMGVAGELHIGGAGLSWGYFRRPDLTADRFVPAPFMGGGERLYKTGDLVRYRPDGTLEFLGRLDHQVKVRGFRIELGDIEAALARHPLVREAVAVVQGEANEKKIVAYMVAAPGATLTVSDLRTALKSQLPDYMIPATFAVLDALPLTPNGKIDRRALPAPDTVKLGGGKEYVAPRTPAEEALAEIWAELLKVERVGIHDNFFELGGDSLLVVRMVVKAGQAGLSFTTKQLFQHPTIAELAQNAGAVKILAEQGMVTGEMIPPIAVHQFFEQSHPIANYHSLTFLLEAQQRLDVDLMKMLVLKMAEHHDSFRVRLVKRDGRYLLDHDAPPTEAPLTVIDLSHLDEEAQWDAIDAATIELQTRFDMYAGTLFHTLLFELGDERPQRFLIGGHYLVADVLSWQIFVADLDSLYRKVSGGQPLTLPAKATSVQQWTQRISEYAKAPTVEKEIPYWTRLADKPYFSLPRDYPDGINYVGSAGQFDIVLDEAQTNEILQTICKKHDIPIHATVLSAIMLAFEPWTGKRVLPLDIYTMGRDALFEDIDLSRTVGWLTFRYPLFLDIESYATPLDVLKRMKRQLGEVPTGGIGYGGLRYLRGDAELTAQLAAVPDAEVFFNFFGIPAGGFKVFKPIDGATGHHNDKESRRIRQLAITGMLIQDRLRMEWEFSRNVFKDETIQGLIANYEAAFRKMIEYCRETPAAKK